MASRGKKNGPSRKSRHKARAVKAAGGRGAVERGRRQANGRMIGGGSLKRRGRHLTVRRRKAGAAKQGAAAGGKSPAALNPAVTATSPPLAGSAAEAARAAYEEGYREGMFDGGEAKLGKLIPGHMLLPELTVDDVIAAGFKSVAGLLHPLLTPADVFAAVDKALQEGRPLSLVRLGDGELLTLAHAAVMSTEEVMRWGAFLPFAGVKLPDTTVREALAAAVRSADFIGIPESRHPSYQGLLFPVLRYYGIDYRKLRLTSSTINYKLNDEGYLARLLTGRRVLLVGNQAQELAEFLGRRGVRISGWIAPVHGVADVPAVMERVRTQEFDLALVAAGVAAVIICARMARECGKVALDLGHVANRLIKGKAVLPQVGEV